MASAHYMGVRWTASLNLRVKVSTSEEPPTLVSLEVSSQLRSEQECLGMSLGAEIVLVDLVIK